MKDVRTLAACCLCALGTLTAQAHAQTPSLIVTQPLNEAGGDFEFMSREGIVEVDYQGVGSGDELLVRLQFLAISADGISPPSRVGSPVSLVTTESLLVADTDLDGEHDDLIFDDHAGPIRFDMNQIFDRYAGVSNTFAFTLNTVYHNYGVGNGAVVVQIIFESPSGDVSTANPTTFNANGSGQFNPEATTPRLLHERLDVIFAALNTNCDDLILAVDATLDNGDPSNPNNIDLLAINANEIEIADSELFESAASPSSLASTPRLNQDALTFLSIPIGTQVPPAAAPEPGQYVRVVGSNLRDFTGRRLSMDLDGAFISGVQSGYGLCPGDCDFSRVIDFGDLIMILSRFEQEPTGSTCDPTGDGKIDFQDLVAALFNLGDCPDPCDAE